MRIRERRARQVPSAGQEVDPVLDESEPILDTQSLATAYPPQADEDPWPMARISVIRAGFYAISEAGAPRAGTIYGDYVIGFTVTYGNFHGRFATMAEVHQFVGEAYAIRHGLAVQAS
ncbi:hypothetical protein [Nostocoides sp. HKS02]|uniref:hypothetical protein n=1 Tax=Nostocoides sp. HKS02 TaxID=1813880 RepID=UPI0012B4CB2D|nr:hypothetical protein [Tetrasphaera sp. HKS02]QGN58796.1 hypothetical protein GKE56_13960 [Tetrasphaera sp. HKS02]